MHPTQGSNHKITCELRRSDASGCFIEGKARRDEKNFGRELLSIHRDGDCDGWEITTDSENLNVIIFCNLGREVALAPHPQVAANKGLKITVEDLIDIANFYAGA
jgi:hypothetical protein